MDSGLAHLGMRDMRVSLVPSGKEASFKNVSNKQYDGVFYYVLVFLKENRMEAISPWGLMGFQASKGSNDFKFNHWQAEVLDNLH